MINLVETTIWDEPLPKIVSMSRWQEVVPDNSPPVGVTYQEWLCCVTRQLWWNCFGALENGDCEIRDVYETTRRWSPRRNHAAAVLNKEIFLMGGRARDLDDIPPQEAIGGIIRDQRVRWRERSQLRNDVWSSPDGGTCS